LSSARPPDAANRCRQLNIARWLQKPVKQSDLLNALRTVFQKIPAENFPQDQTISRRADHVPALRILLAEDGLVNQRVAVGFLEMRGHQVMVANTGKEALAALEKQPFDLVLMDVHMPEMDGIETTAAIRAKEQATGQHLPIIAMTASAMKGDRERCLDAGMDGYVSKPFNAQELFEAVEGIVAVSPVPATPTLPMPSKPAIAIEMGDLAEILDWEAAQKRLRGRAESLARTFVQEVPKLIVQIRAAISSGDAILLHRAAHTLKGSADIFSAKIVAQAAWELECMGRDGRMEGANEAWEDLNPKIKQLISALETLSKVSSAV
jgi:two-component system sensor histidine kinase/response regulator